MAKFILTSEEKEINSPLEWDDDALGKAAINAAIIWCEQNDGTVNINSGIKKASAIIAGLTCDVFHGVTHAFTIQIRDSNGKINTYCITIQQQKYEENNTMFSAVVNGKRINTNNGNELVDLIENSEKFTEFTIQYNKEK